MSLRKDLNQTIKEARKRGWVASHTRNGHLRLTHPRYGVTHMGSTPSDPRGLRNFKAQIKRKERSHGADPRSCT